MTIALSPNPNPTSDAEREALFADLGFGRYFTDNMVTIDWNGEQGWHNAQLRAYGPLSLDPASMVFHYGQEIFEGLKAYHQPDGGIALFRPSANAKRFQYSARRLALPELPEELFMESIKVLVNQEHKWVPTKAGESLYLRPLMIGNEAALGVRPSKTALFVLIASPAGSYFKGGVKPVTVWISTEYVRAAPGGTGAAKCGGNYAASLVAQAQAAENGCDQVVWLDAVERRWVEEMGGMNLYFVKGSGKDATVMTPALTGTLLPGVTRDSLLSVAQDLGYRVEEGKISVEDWRSGVASGQITEVFACGTAAVITPVGSVKSETGNWQHPEANPITMQLRETLLGIQSGQLADRHNWMVKIR